MTTQALDIHKLEKLRHLGALEQFSSARHHLGFMNNVGVSANYTHHSQSTIALKETIFSALSVVVLRHAILSAIPVDEDSTEPYFARLPSIYLRNTVTFSTRTVPVAESGRDVELDDILEKEHNIGFKADYGVLPCWRLIILLNYETENEFVASFIFHHALGDGASGMVFHKHFLAALHASPAPLRSKVIYPPKTALLPSLEQLHPLPMPAPSMATPPAALWAGEKISLPMTCKFRSLTIEKETTQRFVKACRAHGTTLTATIPAIIASVLMQLIPESFGDLECTVPVNIRRWLPDIVDDESFGLWIDAFSQFYNRNSLPSFSWPEAQRSRSTILAYLTTNGASISVGKFKAIPDMQKFFLSRIDKERTSSFDVSNLGGMAGSKSKAGDSQADWTVGKMVFSRCAFASGSAISASVVSGGDGCLVFGFSWQEGIVEVGMLEAMMEKVKLDIERIALEI